MGIASTIITALQFVPLAVLAVAVALAILFRKLLDELRELRRTVGVHHVVLTAVGTMHGLVEALEHGLESGGLPDPTREAIFRAHAEQVRFVYDRVGAVSGQVDLFAESIPSRADLDRPISRHETEGSTARPNRHRERRAPHS
jgi:hypothetical protein